MKRKLTSGIFALAALLTVSSAFYSCKDYDEELTADYNSKITTLKSELESRLSTAEGEIDALQSTVESQGQTITSQGNDISALKDSASTHAQQIASLKSDLSDVKDDVSNLTSDFGDLKVRVNNVADSVSNHEGRIVILEGKYETLNSKISVVDSTVTVMNTKLGTLAEITVPALQSRVDSTANALNNLTSRVDRIEKILKEMVTGLAVRSVESPVIGSLILPVDVQANILAAYYGQTLADLNFPTAKLEGSIDPTDAIALWNSTESKSNADYYGATSKTNAFFAEASDTLYSTAGTVYLNIIPSTVDFTGKNIQLVNSQNEETSGLELSPVQPSDKVLTFGYSRAEGNQLYASEATVKDLNKAKFVISESAQEAVAQLQNAKTNGINYKNLATQLQSAMTNLGEVYKVQAAWSDTDANGVETPHFVTSEANIGAYAVKPLSFETMKGQTLGLTGIPSIDEIIEKIDGKVDAAMTRVIVDGDNTYVRIYFTIGDGIASALSAAGASEGDYLDDVTVAGKEYPAYLSSDDDKAYINYPFSDIKNQISAKLSAAENTKAADFYTKAQTLANKVISYVNNPNALLQPVVLYANNEGGFSTLSENQNIRTELTKDADVLTIYPTTLTTELLAPAYKKYVALLQTATRDSIEPGTDPVPYECDTLICSCGANHTNAKCYFPDGTPRYKEYCDTVPGDTAYYCHPKGEGGTPHRIGSADCDITYCTCAPGTCPNKYCVNYYDEANGNAHYPYKTPGTEDVIHHLTSSKAIWQKTFDGEERVLNIAGLAKGQYTLIYQALDYYGKIVTKYYYIDIK